MAGGDDAIKIPADIAQILHTYLIKALVQLDRKALRQAGNMKKLLAPPHQRTKID